MRSNFAFTKYYGMNNTSSAVELKYEATSIKNFLLKKLGKLTTRRGLTQTGSDTGSLKQLGLTHYISGATEVQIKVEGTVIQKLTGATWASMSGGTGLTTGLDMNFCFANGYLYGFNGTDTVRRATNTLVTTVAGIPVGKWAIWWRNYLFVGGVSAYPNRVYFSNLGDPETFSASDYIDIEPGDGDALTGGIGTKDKVLFSKKGAWYYLVGSGTNTFAIYPITYDFGSCNFRGITNYGNDVWCVDNEGKVRSVIRNQYGLFSGQDMASEFIVQTLETINKGSLDTVCSTYIDGRLLIAVPTGSATKNDLVLVYNGDAPVADGKSKWTTITGWNPACFDAYDNTLYIGDSNATSLVFSWAGNDDNGTAIDCEWIGPEMAFQNEGRKKRFLGVKWFAKPLGDYDTSILASVDENTFGDLGDLNLATDSPLWGATDAVWGTGVWGVSGKVGDYFHYSTGCSVIGTKVQNKISYQSENGEAEIGSHVIYFEYKKWRPE